ncbi:GtrA family protein [uncultured Megasphaera sp.]|uniref:GtrA family protein n=1 Tax=uncultured Megasphaera sp. TaxID=165188 RepID=UPI0034582755
MSKDRLWEIVRFCIVGGASFLVDYGLLYVCTEFLKIYYLYSSALSFTVSVIFNYWLCIIYVFEDVKKQNKKQATLFIGSSIVGLGLNQICMYFLVSIIGIYYMLAKILATIIVTVWNYVMKRKAVQG